MVYIVLISASPEGTGILEMHLPRRTAPPTQDTHELDKAPGIHPPLDMFPTCSQRRTFDRLKTGQSNGLARW
jgi:hypothetical protein